VIAQDSAITWVAIACGGLAMMIWGYDKVRTVGNAKDLRTVAGLASRRQITRAAGAKVLLRQAGHLRPSLAAPVVAELGHRLGRACGVDVWMDVRGSAFVVGAPSSGKTSSVVIPAILDAPGAVVTTATRTDNLTATLEAAQARGPVGVFDPQGLAGGVGGSLRWSPVRGCEAPRVAMVRAKALTCSAAAGTEDSSYWRARAEMAVRCLLHAAALAGEPPATLYRWSLNVAQARQAVTILAGSKAAAAEWHQALEGILGEDSRTRDSIWSMVALAFSELADPDVLEAVSPEGEGFDPEAFLRGAGTLYLLGTSTGAGAAANLIGALVEDIVETARGLAAHSPNARLDPPLSLILDEAANYPLPSLGSLMSEGGGTGISPMVVFQSLSQARAARGKDVAAALWEAATIKLVLPGMANAGDLADVARLCGEREEQQVTTSSGRGQGSRSTSKHKVPVLSTAQLREMRTGLALLLLRTAPPIILEMEPWWSRPDARVLQAGKVRTEDLIGAVR